MSRLFDRIAPIYGLFFNYQRKHYQEILNKIKGDIDLKEYSNIIDFGCGTGALCLALENKGLEVTGVDSSSQMLKVAIRKTRGTNIKYYQGSILEKLPFEDNSFDIVIASYVAHGLKRDERVKMYREMSRLTSNLVILHDYNKKRSLLTDIVEWLERGDYFNFIKNVEEELRDSFTEVRIIDINERAAWYVCKNDVKL
jgi:ubiquinone/menaquinone biosynthesis C-methylase UbiE